MLAACSGMRLDQNGRADKGNAATSMPNGVLVRSYGPYAQEHREKEMKALWVNQTYESLLKALGPPTMVMTIPAYRPWKASVIVYKRSDTSAGCIDAFTIAHMAESMVYDYFCR